MTEQQIVVFFVKLFISLTVMTICEINQSKPYYYKREILGSCIVLALCPLTIAIVMYFVTAYLLRMYPYSVVRGFMWPIEVHRNIVKSITNRYPSRKF